MRRRDRTALLAVSRPGCDLAIKLGGRIPEADLFLPEGPIRGEHRAPRYEVLKGDPRVHLWEGRARDVAERLFAGYRRMVIFGSVGMAVRLLAPLVKDKRADPAVVVVDDGARYAVSLLSGHLGGANRLAVSVAEALGAHPVVTTASDILGLPATDILGRDLGWTLENGGDAARVSASMVNGEVVGLLQEAGEPGWWPKEMPWPPNLLRVDTIDDLVTSGCRAAIIITDRLLPEQQLLPPHVVVRPRSLVVGIGCNRGTGPGEIEGAMLAVLAEHRLSPASVAAIATVELKRSERGLAELAEAMGVEILFFPAKRLDAVPRLPSPSPTVARWVGSRGVCEPAALLASGATSLLVEKQRIGNVTVAVARRVFDERGDR